MITSTKQLSAALSECGRVIKTRTTLPILSHVRLQAAEGVLEITATNLDAWVTRLVKCSGNLEPCCVSLHKFAHLVSAASTDDVSMTLKGHRLKLKAAGVCELSTLQANEFPPSPKQSKELAVIAQDLADGIEAVEWLPNGESNKDKGNVTKVNVCVDLTAKSLDCVSYIGVVMAHFQRSLICETRTLLIPNAFAPLLVPVLREDEARVFASDTAIMSSSKHGSVSVKLSDGKYGAWRENMASIKYSAAIELETEPLLRATNCVQALYEMDRYPKIIMEATGDTLKISSESTDPWTDEIPLISEPGWISINARYLSNALKHLDAKKVKCSIADNGTLWSSADLEILIGQLGTKPVAERVKDAQVEMAK
jgi:DNA polymerase-3 subunit beta